MVIQCPTCGKQAKYDQAYCEECGVDLQYPEEWVDPFLKEPEKKKTCITCKYKMDTDSRCLEPNRIKDGVCIHWKTEKKEKDLTPEDSLKDFVVVMNENQKKLLISEICELTGEDREKYADFEFNTLKEILGGVKRWGSGFPVVTIPANKYTEEDINKIKDGIKNKSFIALPDDISLTYTTLDEKRELCGLLPEPKKLILGYGHDNDHTAPNDIVYSANRLINTIGYGHILELSPAVYAAARSFVDEHGRNNWDLLLKLLHDKLVVEIRVAWDEDFPETSCEGKMWLRDSKGKCLAYGDHLTTLGSEITMDFVGLHYTKDDVIKNTETKYLELLHEAGKKEGVVSYQKEGQKTNELGIGKTPGRWRRRSEYQHRNVCMLCHEWAWVAAGTGSCKKCDTRKTGPYKKAKKRKFNRVKVIGRDNNYAISEICDGEEVVEIVVNKSDLFSYSDCKYFADKILADGKYKKPHFLKLRFWWDRVKQRRIDRKTPPEPEAKEQITLPITSKYYRESTQGFITTEGTSSRIHCSIPRDMEFNIGTPIYLTNEAVISLEKPEGSGDFIPKIAGYFKKWGKENTIIITSFPPAEATIYPGDLVTTDDNGNFLPWYPMGDTVTGMVGRAITSTTADTDDNDDITWKINY